MIVRSVLAAAAFAASGTFGAPALAQDAAETATILSAQGQGTARAQRSLGSAISGSLNNSAATISTAGPRRAAQRGSRPNSRGGGTTGNITLTTNDPLAGTDAATYQTSGGTTIRVSGRMNPSAGTACVNNCPEDQKDD